MELTLPGVANVEGIGEATINWTVDNGKYASIENNVLKGKFDTTDDGELEITLNFEVKFNDESAIGTITIDLEAVLNEETNEYESPEKVTTSIDPVTVDPFYAVEFTEEFLENCGEYFKFEWTNILTGKFFVVFFTFLFTDLFDTIGTLMGVTEQAGLVDEDGKIPNAKGALLADAVGTVAGACLGTSTVTSFVESSSGVAAGARTGLASVVTAIMFMLALFFTPLFALIPSAATAPALIFVGFLMMKSVTSIDFEDLSEGIPAFITIMVMPFAYSISKGIAL